MTANPMLWALLGSILRHVLTFGGGIAVAEGLADPASIEAIGGGLTAAVGLVLSWRNKRARAAPEAAT